MMQGFFRILLTLTFFTMVSHAADHMDSPQIRGDRKADIADLYAWVPTTDNTKLNLIMTVNPDAGRAGLNLSELFDPSVMYSIAIDTTGDLQKDFWFDCTFEESAGNQFMTVNLKNATGTVIGPTTSLVAGSSVDDTLALTSGDAGTSNNSRVRSGTSGGLKVFAGLRDDPFFFDFVQYKAFLSRFSTNSTTNAGQTTNNVVAAYTPTLGNTNNEQDFFRGRNVAAIAIQINKSQIATASTTINVWGTTKRKALRVRRAGLDEASRGAWVQVDRVGKPGINTVLITNKNAFNRAMPTMDITNYKTDAMNTIGALNLSNLSGVTGGQYSSVLASVLLSDVLRVQLGTSCAFKTGANQSANNNVELVNCYGQILYGGHTEGGGALDIAGGAANVEFGRHPLDDVIDLSLTAIVDPGLSIGVIGDQVNSNDRTLETSFPYLGHPWK